MVKADAEKIHALIKENLNHFQAEEDSDHWRSYVEYLDDVVLDGLFDCVQCSLLYFMENTDKEREMPPLLMAKLELQVCRIILRTCICNLHDCLGTIMCYTMLRYALER